MNETPLLTLENTIVTWQKKKAQQHVINLSSDFDEDKKQASNESKRLIIVCCEETANYFNQALKVGLTEDDLPIFLDALKDHEFGNISNWWDEDIGQFAQYAWILQARELGDLLSSNELRSIFLDSLLDDFKSFNGRSEHINFLKLRKRLQELEEGTPKVESTNSEFTTSRQILAIYYLLNYARLSFGEINRTDLARLIQFLTGKEASNPKISNTTVYKKCKALYSDSEKKNIQDLRYILKFFEKPGFEEIGKMIITDIDNVES